MAFSFGIASAMALMQATQHMRKIEEILDECGFPAQRFRNQQQFISAMLFPGEIPLGGCIGQQYSPPPEHDFPMFILATNIRIVAFISNTDVDSFSPTITLSHPLNRIENIIVYDGDQEDAEIRLQYKNNRRVAVYRGIVSSVQNMMDQLSKTGNDTEIYRSATPMKNVYSLRQRIAIRAHWWRRGLRNFTASPTLTILLNILLALAVIAQAWVLATQGD